MKKNYDHVGFKELKKYSEYVYCEDCLAVVGETNECLCLVDTEPCCEERENN